MKYRIRKTTKYLIIHDSHTPPSILTPIQWLRHNGRVMGLLDIGYNAVIDRNGVVTETRPREAVGSHTPAYNHESFGVCLIGGLDEEGVQRDTFTHAQKMSLAFLISQLRREFGDFAVTGHSEMPRFKNRPGAACLAMDMNGLRAFLKEHAQ